MNAFPGNPYADKPHHGDIDTDAIVKALTGLTYEVRTLTMAIACHPANTPGLPPLMSGPDVDTLDQIARRLGMTPIDQENSHDD